MLDLHACMARQDTWQYWHDLNAPPGNSRAETFLAWLTDETENQPPSRPNVPSGLNFVP
jgi:hypothetical protein